MNTNKTYIVRSIVPTVYQISSLSTLMGGNKPWGGGRYGWEEEFFSIEQAKEWMHMRNDFLHSDGTITEPQHEENKLSIDDNGFMYYDAASARIEEVTND